MILKDELKKLKEESKITLSGIVITFIMSFISLYMQYNEKTELSVIANFYGTTTLAETLDYRLTFVNSGNTPVSIEHVYARIESSESNDSNSKIDLITPFVIEPRGMKVIDYHHELFKSKIRGASNIYIAFSVVDVNAKLHKNTFNLGELEIGSPLLKQDFKIKSLKMNLITGSQSTI